MIVVITVIIITTTRCSFIYSIIIIIAITHSSYPSILSKMLNSVDPSVSVLPCCASLTSRSHPNLHLLQDVPIQESRLLISKVRRQQEVCERQESTEERSEGRKEEKIGKEGRVGERRRGEEGRGGGERRRIVGGGQYYMLVLVDESFPPLWRKI